MGACANVIRPDVAPDWAIGRRIRFLFPRKYSTATAVSVSAC